jgi:EAL domain-containing protein (putative c-di-GMP-specific phosphodiesterase class I)
MVKRIEKLHTGEKNVYYLDDGEFGLLLNNLVNTNPLQPIAQKLLKQIRKPFIWDNTELNCSACIGIALADNPAKRELSLIRHAELALDVAVEDGFNTFRFYDEGLKQRTFDQINIENALHKALDRNEFKIYYQPKIDSKNKQIIGSEALIRWENAEYGLLSPTQFVPMAEENGLIIPIGEWVLENICKQLNIWKNDGIDPEPVAINISARQLEQKNFVHSITSILDKRNIENELLEIELTESILLKNSLKNSKKLSKLREKGMKVSIDDFGTGYSSLSYLSNFPFDKLKIDQSFIRDITTDKAAAALATSIISMAHSLGVRVIAEGVETEAQLDFLKTYHCDEIQGYYFSKPINADEFTSLLKDKHIPISAI